MTATYFQPTRTIEADDIIDHSGMVGIVSSMLVPANADRIGFMIQNNSETNDFWFGYDNAVTIGGAGYYCLRAGDSRPWTPPPNGVYRGAIYGLSDGGGNITIKEWISQ